MLTVNCAPRIDNFGAQPAASLVPQSFLFVGNEGIAKAVLELSSRGPRRGCLGYDVTPDSQQQSIACFRWIGTVASRSSIFSHNSPVRATRSQRIGMNYLNARSGKIGKIADALGISGS